MSDKDINKSEIDAIVADKLGIDPKKVDGVTNEFLKTVIDKLSQGLNVDIHGFGTFVVYERKARRGRNPQTGEEIQIPAKTAAKFKPWKKMRDAVAK